MIESEMASALETDLIIAAVAIVIAAVVIYLFVRATGSKKKEETKAEQMEAEVETIKEEPPLTQPTAQTTTDATRETSAQRQTAERHFGQTDVERARSDLKTLSLQRELIGMVLKRLFEAEDEGEITREERLRLSKDYEAELKKIAEDVKRSELIVTLNELEAIREDVLKRFEATLNNTQAKIDGILKELKLEEAEKPTEEAPRRKKQPPKEGEGAEEEKSEEAEEAEAEEKPEPKKTKSEVDEKLEQLRKEVLKELDELEKLEIEA
jgi:hypothetical protein